MEYWDHMEEKYISLAIETVVHRHRTEDCLPESPESRAELLKTMARQITQQAHRFRALTESALREYGAAAESE